MHGLKIHHQPTIYVQLHDHCWIVLTFGQQQSPLHKATEVLEVDACVDHSKHRLESLRHATVKSRASHKMHLHLAAGETVKQRHFLIKRDFHRACSLCYQLVGHGLTQSIDELMLAAQETSGFIK
jgi:hypothetical protein